MYQDNYNYIWWPLDEENLKVLHENIGLGNESIEFEEKSHTKISDDMIKKSSIIMVNKEKRTSNKGTQTINNYEEKTSNSEKVYLEHLLKINEKINCK